MTHISFSNLGKLGAAFGLVTSSAIAGGCVPTRISPELASAREVYADARRSGAVEHEPDELLVARRTLERAEAADDGSDEEVALAYIADRQARIAMSNARRAVATERIASEEDAYQEDLEHVAQSRGEALEDTSRALSATHRALGEQSQAVAETRQALNEAERARADAEARAADAMNRLRELAAVREDQGRTVITLSGEVLFESDRHVLRPEARSRLLAVADALRASPPTNTVVIEGHTDSRGSASYNCNLSDQRARAVYEYLIAEGVPAERMRAVGVGEAQPITDNRSAEGRANNRRVEIVIGARGNDLLASACSIEEMR
jgi:outer membrane protein OmpA-like peptidoglycan-associated protein